MRPQTELSEPAAGVADEITALAVLDEFLAVMHEWGFRAYRHPLSQGVCGGVELPGPDELAACAQDARREVAWVRAERSPVV